MPELYQAMDVFVFPSVFEGLGIVALEAQAAGVPCAVADTLPKEVKINGNFQFVSLRKSPEQWAEIIQDIYEKSIMNKENEEKMLKSVYNIEKQVYLIQELFLEE